MKLLVVNKTPEVVDKILEYFPGIELVEDCTYDVAVNVDSHKDVMSLIRFIRSYCPKYLQEYAEDLEEVMNETRDSRW